MKWVKVLLSQSSCSLFFITHCGNLYTDGIFCRSPLHGLVLYWWTCPLYARRYSWLSHMIAINLLWSWWSFPFFLFFFFFFFHSKCHLLVDIHELIDLLLGHSWSLLKYKHTFLFLSLTLGRNGFTSIVYLRSDVNPVLFGNFYVTYLHVSLIQCNSASISLLLTLCWECGPEWDVGDAL